MLMNAESLSKDVSKLRVRPHKLRGKHASSNAATKLVRVAQDMLGLLEGDRVSRKVKRRLTIKAERGRPRNAKANISEEVAHVDTLTARKGRSVRLSLSGRGRH